MHYLIAPYSLMLLLYIYFIRGKTNEASKTGLFIIFMAFLIVLGGALVIQDPFGDPYRYMVQFEEISEMSFGELPEMDHPEVGYRYLNWIVGQVTPNHKVLFLVIYLFVLGCTYYSLKIQYPGIERFQVFMFISLYPFFLFYVVNGKRQGMTLAMLLVVLALMQRRKSFWAYFLLPLGMIFHTSMGLAWLFLTLFFIIKQKYRLKSAIIFCLTSVGLSIAKLSSAVIGGVASLFSLDPRYQEYLKEDSVFVVINYRTGFRPDFFLFSMIPLGLYIYYRKSIKEEHKERVDYWLGAYLFLNSIYHLFSAVPFGDRFAIFSWFILPIVSYEIVRGVKKGHAQIMTVVLLIVNILFLQLYSGKIFASLDLF